MKVRSGAAAAMAVAGAYAQSTTSSRSSAWPVSSATTSLTTAPPVIYTTVTYSDCDSSSIETMITITNGVTVTYCPKCEQEASSSAAAAHSGGYTTVYTTTYQSLCPTGIVPATYTVTESCTNATPTWTPGPSHIPDGFTVTVKDCTVCASTPTAVTITEPCGCQATNGVPVTSPAGSSPSSGATPAGNTPAGSTPTSSPGASSPACTGDKCGGSGSQSPAAPGSPGATSPPYPSTSTAQCPGPQCRAAATGSPPQTNTTQPITPYTGGAAASSMNGLLSSMVLAVMVGLFAFAL